MPLPFGHSLMGYTLYETLEQKRERTSWATVLLFAVVANLPDIDFLPGFLVGNPNLYHHHYLSHSLGAALVVGALLGGYYAWRKDKSFLGYFLIFTTVYFSHVVLDYFTQDTSGPFGVPMFWPFSKEFVISPVPIFLSVHKVGRSDVFFQNLFVVHNLLVAVWEVVVFLPVLAVVKLVKFRKKLLLRIADEKN
ncbi:MAG: metal-dependent hydrolase [Calditrichaeota bacterium]|nr:MAG: metal-dependent hydrolase [Calditrichota bacterium]